MNALARALALLAFPFVMVARWWRRRDAVALPAPRAVSVRGERIGSQLLGPWVVEMSDGTQYLSEYGHTWFNGETYDAVPDDMHDRLSRVVEAHRIMDVHARMDVRAEAARVHAKAARRLEAELSSELGRVRSASRKARAHRAD